MMHLFVGVMNKFIIILVLLILSPSCFSQSEREVGLIYNLKINEIKDKDDCLSVLYINSITALGLSKDALRECIADSNLVGRYYLYLASYNHAIYKLDYQLAIESLKSVQQVRGEIENKNNESIGDDKSIIDKAYLLSLQNEDKGNSIVYLKKKEKKFIYHDPISDQEFLFDTGSLFWSVKQSMCRKDAGRSVNVTGSNGLSSAFYVCKMGVNDYSGYALVADKNIAGLTLALSKRALIFENKFHHKKNIINFYFDNDLIIINDTTKINDVDYSINTCIDTGAEHSFITPKLYKKIRHSIKGSKLNPLLIKSFTGNYSTYGRIVKFFSSEFFTLNNVYAISNGNLMHPCDLVIGNDILFERIMELNISERKLVLKI